MKQTLLEMTQAVLRSIKGEQVNSISDTQESQDVADIIKECYGTLIAQQDFPEAKTIFELNASGDNLKPVLMTIPDDVYGIEWLKYNIIEDGYTDPVWRTLTHLPLKDFIDYTQQFNIDETEVASMALTINSDSVDFKYYNDRAPRYFTSIDDEKVIFDSYDSVVDTTLQKTKTMGYGLRITWTVSDSFIPELDAQQFPILLKDAKVVAWQELKSVDNVLAARQSRDLRISAEGKKNRSNYNNNGYYNTLYPNYGRK